MSHCRTAAGANGHDHHDHGHSHDHEHDHSDDITPALQHSLYEHIRFDDIVTLNEAETHSGKGIVKKTWSERLQPFPVLQSDTDAQLLINIPFTGQVKLHSIILRTSAASDAPRTLRVFINRDDIDFSNVEDLSPTQEFELSQTSEVQEVPVKRALFSKVRRLTLFFVDNFASRLNASDDDDDDDSDAEIDSDQWEPTWLGYIGLKGEWMQLGRAPTNIIYEAAANPNDHALKGTHTNAEGMDIHRR